MICEALKENMAAEIERIHEQRQYNRVTAYVTGFAAALSGAGRAIMPLAEDVAAYDRIVIAVPVWAAHIAPPMVTFLRCYDLKDKPIYAIVTHTGETGNIEDVVKEEIERAEGVFAGLTLMKLSPELIDGLRKKDLALWLNTETGKVQIEQMVKGYPHASQEKTDA